MSLIKTEPGEKAAQWECQRVALSILGGIIVGTFTDGSGRWGFEVLNPMNNGSYRVWVNCDQEGNGPGSLEVIHLTTPTTHHTIEA
jgi:hypothetical protein